MQYTNIVLELLQEQYPTLHQLLREEKTLFVCLEEYARELRTAHLAWIEEIHRANPETGARQIASEALELAIEHLQGSLPCEPLPDEAVERRSPKGSMMFLIRRMRAA